MGYYYFIAQLPALAYGQGAPMTSEHFRELCRGMLSSRDAALLAYCALDPDAVLGGKGRPYEVEMERTDSTFINGWYQWERALRLHLARLRGGALKREGTLDPPVLPAAAEAAAKAAFALDSPLDGELFLDKSRWDAIDALQGLDYFSRNTIYAYLLKLLLLERRAALRQEEGFAEYKALYASIIEGVSMDGSEGSTRSKSGEPK